MGFCCNLILHKCFISHLITYRFININICKHIYYNKLNVVYMLRICKSTAITEIESLVCPKRKNLDKDAEFYWAIKHIFIIRICNLLPFATSLKLAIGWFVSEKARERSRTHLGQH